MRLLSKLVYLGLLIHGVSFAQDKKAEVPDEALTVKEQVQLERMADRKRIESLQKMYSETGAGSVAFDHTYLIDKPMKMEEIRDLTHPYFTALYEGLSSYDKEAIDESVKEGNFQSARYQAILNVALKYGMQAGDHYTSNMRFERFKNELYAEYSEAFPFQAFMLAGGKIKPPLIEEMDFSSTIEDKRTRREIKKRYQIAEQAEVIHVAPNFLEFFANLRSERPKMPSAMLLPRNEEEMKFWKRGVVNGWAEGVKQAEMNTRFYTRNLIRTFYGYIRFHALHDKGMITMPTYNNLVVGTTSRGDIVNIGETVFEITELPQINGNEQDWLALPQVDDIFDKITDEDLRELSEELYYEVNQ